MKVDQTFIDLALTAALLVPDLKAAAVPHGGGYSLPG